jgi:hypothetical protein
MPHIADFPKVEYLPDNRVTTRPADWGQGCRLLLGVRTQIDRADGHPKNDAACLLPPDPCNSLPLGLDSSPYNRASHRPESGIRSCCSRARRIGAHSLFRVNVQRVVPPIRGPGELPNGTLSRNRCAHTPSHMSHIASEIEARTRRIWAGAAKSAIGWADEP